jgi:hypothetical protein
MKAQVTANKHSKLDGLAEMIRIWRRIVSLKGAKSSQFKEGDEYERPSNGV